MRPRGHVRHLAFGDRGHAKYAMGPKQSLEGVLFGLKSPSLSRAGRPFLASNVIKVTVISCWNGLNGSMGPDGHVRSLALVMGALTGAQWVQNDRLRGSFLA